jgi:hypothetical protein
MIEQPKIETFTCASCAVVVDDNILVSAQIDEKWSLLLCPKKVKQKLLKLGCPPTKINEAYKRFVENFAHFSVCPHSETAE